MKPIRQIESWEAFEPPRDDAHIYCEQTYYFNPDLQNYSLYLHPSAVEGARDVYSGSFLRDCDAIYDFRIEEKGQLEAVDFEINHCVFNSKRKENGRWEIEDWFTLEHPFLAVVSDYAAENVILDVDEDHPQKREQIVVRWKSMRYNHETRVKLGRMKLIVGHGPFELRYDTGNVIPTSKDGIRPLGEVMTDITPLFK